MKRTRYRMTAILLCVLFVLNGCTAQTAGETSSTAETAGGSGASAVSAIDTDALFSDRDIEGTYDESAAIPIQLNGDSASCDSDAVIMESGQIIIGTEGVYLLSGTLTDGQIVVNAGNTDKVQLVLGGADITSSTSAAIYALEADKVFITLAEGTENALANGGEYVAIDDNNIDAVIFSKTDLTLNGSGSLMIDGAAGHGVVSKDELTVTGGSYAISSGKDEIHAENSDDATLGTLYIAGGSFTIASGGDVTTNDGSEENPGQMGGGRVGQPGDMGGERPEGQKGMR